MSYEITLGAANYVSEERQRAFEGSLARGRGRQNGMALAPTDQSDADVTEPALAQRSPGADDVASVPGVSTAPAAPNGNLDSSGVLESLERGLSQSYDHQSETLRVHQHYLSNEAAYTGIFAQLMQEQGALFVGTQSASDQSELLLNVMQALSQSLAQFHDHQSQTLTVHSQFLEQQAVYAQSFVDLLQRHYGAVLQGHGHNGGNGNGDGNGRGHSAGNGGGNGHPGVVARGNGHEPGQSAGIRMPSGIGMPSGAEPVAPVGEVATPSHAAPAATWLPAAVTPARNGVVGARVASDPAEAATKHGPRVPDAVDAPSADVLVASLLSIVSEKTGYPAEMLALDMDMEADLGIDSIKRVEILGALEEAHPDLPALAPETLAEIRTLEQIVSAVAVRRAAPSEKLGSLERSSSEPVDLVVPAVASTNTWDVSSVTQDVLAIVSEKTGYPAEMLDLSMDMEADLGIDSIKRVEIMGALQEMHPDLGDIEAEALAELRTLASILDHVTRASSVAEAASPKKA